MTEAKKQIDLVTEKLDQTSSQVFSSSYNHESFIFIKIKRFISFVNSHKKPTSEQQENFNTKAVQFLEELNRHADTTKQIKQSKHRKTKSESKSIKLKISKEKNVKESKDTTPAPASNTSTTVIAQIHATDNHDEIHNDDGEDKHNLDPDKTLKKVKSSKRIKISSKKLKTSEDENEMSTKKKKKPGKKLKEKKKDKTNKLNNDADDDDVDDDDDDNVSSNVKTTLKSQDNQKLTEIPEIETDEIEEIELENEETELEDNINQVQPFQIDQKDIKKGKQKEINDKIEKISSQNVLQLHSEILDSSSVDISSEPVESKKCEMIDLFYQTIRQWIGDDEDDLSFKSGETLKILEKEYDYITILFILVCLKKIVMHESEWENLKLDYIKQKDVLNKANIQAEDSPQTYSDDDDADEVAEEEKNQANAVSKQKVNKENIEVKSSEITKTSTSVNQIPDYTEDSVEYGEETWENDEKEGEGDETSENFDIEEDEESEDEDNNVEEDNVEIIEEEKVGITQSSKLMHSGKSFASTPFVDTEKRSFKDDQDLSSWYIKNNEKALEAYQPLPSSVRLSFLSLPGLASYNYQKFLSPKLGNSHLIFTDILLDTDSKKITRRQPRWQKIISIQKITQLSILEESNLSILNCLVRLCLFDGIMPISNICYLPITPTDREKKTWIVTPHNIKKSEKLYELSSDLFVRYNDQNMNICILIEIQIVVSNQDSLPFENGKGNKTSVKDVSLKSRMQNLLFNKTTQVTVRFSQPNKEQQDKLKHRKYGFFSSLPDILIGLIGYAPFLSYHRDFLANIFPGFGRTDDKDRFILRYVQPEVALFPVVADCPLLIECLRKDSEYLKKLYSDHFRRVIYPLLWLQDIEFPSVMSLQQFENESPKVLNLIEQIRQNFMKFITSNQYTFKLFTSKEFTCPIQFPN
ncbi:putative myosin II heavy chain [Schistosoma mansoni]|uniref:putative myosin II heavy chain n=1 Tax=Schistosoma mansoni TaxID=6183 RepID=UPI00022DC3B7|nr:putative myosin II heavy chain [Schistosoma mansoni]|eukprot:XP_018653783.1 putative myosin II heavy chain [Schistosoma mansoni]